MTRPTIVTVFGVLNILFALLGGFGILATAAMLSMQDTSSNPVMQIMKDSPAFAAWMKLSLPLGVLSCVAVLVAGIGLLLMKSWGRVLSIAYGIFSIVFGLAGLAVNVLFLLRPLLEQASREQGPQAMAAIGGAVGGVMGGCIGMIYPILLPFFMTRPKVVAAFRLVTPPSLPSPGT